ncbi:MAG: putative sugar nucleotidyl transferase [Nitrososphaerales archaeon]
MRLNLIVFDDPVLSSNFKPLTYTRAAFELPLGVKSILDRLLDALKPSHVSLMVPEYLKDVVKERNPNLDVNPESVDAEAIMVNGLFDASRKDLLEKMVSKNKDIIILDQDVVAAAKVGEPKLDEITRAVRECKSYSHLLTDTTLTYETPNVLRARYPWHLIELIESALMDDLKEERFNVSKIDAANIQVKGDRSALRIAEGALLEGFTIFDTRRGPVIVDGGCEIQFSTRISGPAYIGKHSLIKSFSTIEGSVIGEGCKIGGEVSNSIILNYTNKAHLGYIGHSIIGEWVNIGAGTNNSDLKNTYGEVKVNIGENTINTKRVKVGCFVGDGVKTSIGTQITTGKKIGPHSHIGGLIDSDIQPFTFCPKGLNAGIETLSLEEAIKVQRRMMNRRGKDPTEAYLKMIEKLFQMCKKGWII